MGLENPLKIKQVGKSRGADKRLHEYYVCWQEDLDLIILYESDLEKMLKNIRKVKNKDIRKLEQEIRKNEQEL